MVKGHMVNGRKGKGAHGQMDSSTKGHTGKWGQEQIGIGEKIRTAGGTMKKGHEGKGTQGRRIKRE